MSKTGVDISTYQRGVNYDEAAQYIDFAILRVGFGVSYLPDKQRDVMFDEHYEGFKGLIPLGAYYYAYGTDYDSGVKEAENCLAYMGDKSFELPIYYDMEENRNTAETGQGFVDRIREAGLKAGIYASRAFYDNKGLADIDCDSVWKAAYGSNNGEPQYNVKPDNCDMWQYTSKGEVSGLGDRIDMNLLFDDIPTPEPGPEPGPEPTPTMRTLYNGCQGDDVRYLQDKLQEKGYDLPRFGSDGYYGDETEEAVRKLQADAGLGIDGICGEQTWGVIESDFVKPDENEYPGYLIGYGDNGEDVRKIQNRLIDLGYDCGPYGADSIFGTDTKNAVIAFQRDNGLAADGIVGPDTWDALF